jgi:predicted NACHT family NTPase
LENWYRHVLKHPTLSSDLRRELEAFNTTLKENTRLHKLATNPLLLTVMTAIHRHERLPDKRVQLYERCADLLLDKWAKLKGVDNLRKEMKLSSKEDQNACIAQLGFVLHERSQGESVKNTNVFPEDEEEYENKGNC